MLTRRLLWQKSSWGLVETMIFRLSLILTVGSTFVTSALVHEFGYEGGEVQISCPTAGGYESYEKYFCRGGCSNSDVLVTTAQGKSGRYSIVNLLSTFQVNISALRTSDAGQYWCGVSRNGADIYTEVKLQIEPDSCCEEVTEVEVTEEESVSFTCQYKPGSTQDSKYLCRGSRPSVCQKDALITTTHASNRQISLFDDRKKREYVVTIQNVKPGDSGRYLCGVQSKPGVFHAFMLKVKEWCCVNSLEVRDVAGEPLTIECHYQAQRRRRKSLFVCKGEHRDNCTDVAPSASIKLRDVPDAKVFQIIMTELTAMDAGTYWCGAEPRWTAGTYTKYHLTVDVPQIQTTSATTSNQTIQTIKTSATEFVLMPFLIVPAVLLVLMIGLVVLLVWRCKVKEADVDAGAAGAAEEAEEDVHSNDNDYENVDDSNAVTSGPQCIHSRAEEQECVYQNVTSEEVYCNYSYCGNSHTQLKPLKGH